MLAALCPTHLANICAVSDGQNQKPQTWSVTMIIARIPRDDRVIIASKDAAALSLESWNAGMHCLQYLSEEVATQSEGSEAPSDQD